MGSATARVSVGDHGVLNASLSDGLSAIWIDRDLSWLDFNERVLAEALDERTPLLERAKFLAIFTSNLDEFFMKRVSVLREGKSDEEKALVGRLRARLLPLLRRQADCFRHELIPALAAHGIFLRNWDELTAAQQAQAADYFENSLSPALTPLVIDPAHPFPFLSNLSTSLTFLLRDPERNETIHARVKVPGVLKQWIPLSADLASGQRLFVSLHEVIRGNAHRLYSGMKLTADGELLLRLAENSRRPSVVLPEFAAVETNLRSAFEEALGNLVMMRQAEGAALSKDLSERLAKMAAMVTGMEQAEKLAPVRHRDAMLKRLKDAGWSLDVNDERVLKEIALFADRSDITEEVVRLNSHVDQFSAELALPNCGRKLDFLIQEFLREVNTIGSKASEIATTKLVLEAKTEIERIREQVQNLE